MNQTLEGYTLRFWKSIFRPKYIDLARSVQSCSVYRYVATPAKHFSVAKTSMDSVVNVTLNLARRLKDIMGKYYLTRLPEKPGKSSSRLSSGL